ncbi:MAG: class I SAM-dependent methyltransferase [Bryobacterales bacterium]|nr:class I SAM-dependent methyltransferase [Bryobacterales bacterium]
MPVLEIGCGRRKVEPDSVGIDRSPDSAADIIWDLDQFPWPLESGSFDRVHMSHVIEHLSDIMRAMGEVHRVTRDEADVFITTPHFSSHNSYKDPTHKAHLAAASFEYFTGRQFETFSGPPFRFEIVRTELTFGGNLVLDNLGRWLSRLSLPWYERHAAWVLPALDIRCHLKVRK